MLEKSSVMGVSGKVCMKGDSELSPSLLMYKTNSNYFVACFVKILFQLNSLIFQEAMRKVSGMALILVGNLPVQIQQ